MDTITNTKKGFCSFFNTFGLRKFAYNYDRQNKGDFGK
jgi:hypothetical protein